MHKTRFGALSVFICLYFTFHSIYYYVWLHTNNTDNSSCVISPLGPKVSASLELCCSSQTAERGESAGVLCQRQQQWQRQRCWGHQDRNQSGHTAVTCGMDVPADSLQHLSKPQQKLHHQHPLHHFLSRVSRAHRYRIETRRRRTRTR